jgi:hypothetical protein
MFEMGMHKKSRLNVQPALTYKILCLRLYRLPNQMFSTKYSAICTALVAAPLRRLSDTIQQLRVFGWTFIATETAYKNFVFIVRINGIGYFKLAISSVTTIPGDFA